MVGRNDPCPCGSGKKYKACCLKKQSLVSIDETVKEELEKIITHFVTHHPNVEELELIKKWQSEQDQSLFEHFPKQDRTYIVASLYMFVYQKDIWINYLDQTIKKAARPRVKAILEQWKTPKFMLLQTVEMLPELLLMKNVLTDELVEVNASPEIFAQPGSYLFGSFLRNQSESEVGYMHIDAAVIPALSNQQKAVFNIKALYEKSGCTITDDFFEKNLIQCFSFINKNYTEKASLPQNEQAVLDLLQTTLIDLDVAYVDLVELVANYFEIEGYPNKMQKVNGFIAGAIYAGHLIKYYQLNITKKQLTKRLDVTQVTANKYEKMLLEFYIRYAQPIHKPTFAIEYGTDPRSSEYGNWQIFMHTKTMDFENFQDMNEQVKQFMNVPYIPMDRHEQSQRLAYEAYDAQSPLERASLAKKAYVADPLNADALLLMIEATNDAAQKETLYQQAIKYAKNQFDAAFERPWTFVLNRPYMRAIFHKAIWHFEKGDYEEALPLFEKLLRLNLEDNQGARLFAISIYIKLNEFAKAKALMHRYHSDSDAALKWLEWAMLKKQNISEANVTKAYEKAIALNVFPEQYMKKHIPPTPFPKRAITTLKSPEEGKIIWLFIAPLLD